MDNLLLHIILYQLIGTIIVLALTIIREILKEKKASSNYVFELDIVVANIIGYSFILGYLIMSIHLIYLKIL